MCRTWVFFGSMHNFVFFTLELKVVILVLKKYRWEACT